MSINKRSVITGLLYIGLALVGPFGFLILPGLFNDASNANLYASEHLLQLWAWIIVEALVIGIEIFLTVYLWKLLNEHNKTLSMIAFLSRMSMIIVMVVNTIFLLAIAFSGGSNADLFIPLHDQMIYVWQLAFSIHVVLIGYIVLRYLKSAWRYLGIALILGAAGYFLDSLNHLILWHIPAFTALATILLYAVTIGEIGMAIALLMKKVVPVKQ